MDFLKSASTAPLAIAYINFVRIYIARVLQNAAMAIAPQDARHTFGRAAASANATAARFAPSACFESPTATMPGALTGAGISGQISNTPSGVFGLLIGLVGLLLVLSTSIFLLAASRAELQRKVTDLAAALKSKEHELATGCYLPDHVDLQNRVDALIAALEAKPRYQRFQDVPWMENTGKPRHNHSDGTVLVKASTTVRVPSDPNDPKSEVVIKKTTPINLPAPPSEEPSPAPFPYHLYHLAGQVPPVEQ